MAITYDEFEKVDIRVGKIIKAELIPNARRSTHKLLIDFGKEIGKKKSCAGLGEYDPKKLIGKKVLGVVNFPPRQIGSNMSEVLTLGVPKEGGDDEWTLIIPETDDAIIGGKLA